MRGDGLAQPELPEHLPRFLDERPRHLELALHRAQNAQRADRGRPPVGRAGALADVRRVRDRLVDGQRAAVQRDADPPQDVVLERAGVGLACVLEGEREPVSPVETGPVPCLETQGLGHREGLVVLRFQEHGHRVVDIGEDPLGRHGGLGPEELELCRDRHPRFQATVAERLGEREPLGQQLLRGGEFALGDQRHGERRQQLEPLGHVAWEERVGPAQQRRGRGHVVSLEGGAPGAGEVAGGSFSKLVDADPALSRLSPGMNGLVEVVARRQVDVAATLDRTTGEPLVELGASPLGQASIRDVTDQAVPERPPLTCGIVGLAGPDELTPDEGQQGGRRIRLDELRDLHRGEGGAADSSRLGNCAVLVVQPIEPRREERLDRIGHCAGVALERRREQLLDEERVALGHGENALSRCLAESAVRGESVE